MTKNYTSFFKNVLIVAGSVSIFFLTVSCSSKDVKTKVVETQVPIIVEKLKPQKAPVTYEARKAVGGGKALRKELGDSVYMLTLKINRRDGVRGNEDVIVPTSVQSILDYSPYPMQMDAFVDLPKMVVISRKVQAFAAYENGMLVRWGPVSSGKKSTQTPKGQYYAYWRSRWHRSTVDSNWILQWSWNIDPKGGGISMHLYNLPGKPASHGCVRLMLDDAKWFYAWADGSKSGKNGMKKLVYGTPVIIFGDYDYSLPQPWKQLPTNPVATDVTEAEILESFEKNKTEVLEHTDWRKQLTSKE